MSHTSQTFSQPAYEPHARCPFRARVLVANSPRAYREAISTVLMTLRPEVEVFTADPEDPEAINREVLRVAPQLVVCSRIPEATGSSVKVWVELYPEGASHATLGMDGWRKRLPGANLEDLLGILDGIEMPSDRTPETTSTARDMVVAPGGGSG